MTDGSCLCGAVRYEVDGPINMMMHCHCSMCRKHHGSGFATFAAAALMGFHWRSGEDNIETYPSSEHGKRAFCRTCGAVTPTLAPTMDLAIFPVGNMRGELTVRPEGHMFVGSKAPWDSITDALPQHEEYPEEFGATGVTRALIESQQGYVRGSCLCDGIAFELSGTPRLMVHCHCSRCRLGRGVAHATNVFYGMNDIKFIRGEELLREYKVPEARYFTLAFCARCGSEMPRISRERDIVVVPAGSLDTDPGVRPTAHIYVGSKANWFEITDALPQHEAAPPI